MSFNIYWINNYNSLLFLRQDPVTGKLQGTYSSTTGGTGTYNVTGWAALDTPSSDSGQPMAIAILWRSNDNGKSDPSHEVSGMAGQVIISGEQLNLSLVHLFIETDPVTSDLVSGIYPDKLIFQPSPHSLDLEKPISNAEEKNDVFNNNIAGTWIPKNNNFIQEIQLGILNNTSAEIEGKIVYVDGTSYPVSGFSDAYAETNKLNLQGISVTSYKETNGKRKCISLAGYLNLSTGELSLQQMTANATSNSSNYQQILLEHLSLIKLNKKSLLSD